MKAILENLAREMKIKNLGFISDWQGIFYYHNTEVNFLLNSEQKITFWVDTKKDKLKNEKVLFTVRQNKQVEIFEFSDFNILEAAKELDLMGQI
jgi:hypothetical protein